MNDGNSEVDPDLDVDLEKEEVWVETKSGEEGKCYYYNVKFNTSRNTDRLYKLTNVFNIRITIKQLMY